MEFLVKKGNLIQPVINKSKPGDTIIIESGHYFEKININKDNLTIIGIGDVTIENSDHFYKIYNDNNFTNTFRTYTIMVSGDQVKMGNLHILNSAMPSSKYGQAVALHVIGTAFLCNNCIIEGAQDTLFLGPLPENLSTKYEPFLPDYQRSQKETCEKFIDCTIIGDVDFIFGCGTSLFENCKIISRGKPDLSYIAAPAHKKDLPYGFLFYKCQLLSEGCKDVYLARPWRDYGMAAYIECEIGNHISEKGFANWQGTQRDKTARFMEYSPNVDLSKRVCFDHILSEKEANDYVVQFKKYIQM